MRKGPVLRARGRGPRGSPVRGIRGAARHLTKEGGDGHHLQDSLQAVDGQERGAEH